MTKFDTRFRAVATRLLKLFGRPATWKTYTESYSPLSGKNERTPVPFTVTVSPRISQEIEYQRGEITEVSRTKIYLAAEGLQFTPNRKDRVTIGGDTYQVLGVHPIESGEQIAAYRVDLGA